MKILVLGKDGMLGHVVTRYFESLNNIVVGTTRNKTGNDIYLDVMTNINDLPKIIEKEKPDVVINCIGILNKIADENKPLAVMANCYLPHYLDELSSEFNYKFIHVSTDCVFDGKNGQYSEDDFKDAVSFYGQSKSLGEIINDRNLTIRTSIVGPDNNPNGIGLFQWFMNQEGTIKGFNKVIWTGVTTIQLAKCMEQAIESNVSGLFHAVNGEHIDKYTLLNLFKTIFNKEIEIIPDDSYASNKSLIVTRNSFVFDIPSYEEMIKDMYDWILKNKDLYPTLITQLGGKNI